MTRTRLNQDLEAQILIDGVVCDPQSIWAHHQADPFPGGHRYEFICSGADTASYFNDVPATPEVKVEKGRESFMLQWITWAFPKSEGPVPFRFVLNTIEVIVKEEGIVRIYGRCSPFVNRGVTVVDPEQI